MRRTRVTSPRCRERPFGVRPSRHFLREPRWEGRRLLLVGTADLGVAPGRAAGRAAEAPPGITSRFATCSRHSRLRCCPAGVHVKGQQAAPAERRFRERAVPGIAAKPGVPSACSHREKPKRAVEASVGPHDSLLTSAKCCRACGGVFPGVTVTLPYTPSHVIRFKYAKRRILKNPNHAFQKE